METLSIYKGVWISWWFANWNMTSINTSCNIRKPIFLPRTVSYPGSFNFIWPHDVSQPQVDNSITKYDVLFHMQYFLSNWIGLQGSWNGMNHYLEKYYERLCLHTWILLGFPNTIGWGVTVFQLEKKRLPVNFVMRGATSCTSTSTVDLCNLKCAWKSKKYICEWAKYNID